MIRMPSHADFLDPASRFSLLRKHRCGFRLPHVRRAGAVLSGTSCASLMYVPEEGVEPSTLAGTGFESVAYTNSATPAIKNILRALLTRRNM